LCEEFPAHVVSAWLGNSVVVAQSHYLQILDKHFEAAVGEEPRKNVAQNPAQSGAELVRTASQPTCGESSQAASVQRDTAPCETVPFPEVTPWGSEQPSKPTRKSQKPKKYGAKSGAVIGGARTGGAALAKLAQSWDSLPPAVRAGIEAMVAASTPGGSSAEVEKRGTNCRG